MVAPTLEMRVACLQPPLFATEPEEQLKMIGERTARVAVPVCGSLGMHEYGELVLGQIIDRGRALGRLHPQYRGIVCDGHPHRLNPLIRDELMLNRSFQELLQGHGTSFSMKVFESS